MLWRSRSRAQGIIRGLPERSCYVCMSALAVCTHLTVQFWSLRQQQSDAYAHHPAHYCLMSQTLRVAEDSPISVAVGPKLIVLKGSVHSISSRLEAFLCKCFYMRIVHRACSHGDHPCFHIPHIG